MAQAPPSKNPWMRMSPMPRAIGVVCIVVGAVWLLQGIGVAQGSVMSGKALWAVLGSATLVVGAVVLLRAHRAAKAAIAAEDAEPPTDTPG